MLCDYIKVNRRYACTHSGACRVSIRKEDPMTPESSSVADAPSVVATENQAPVASPASDVKSRFEDKLAAVRGEKPKERQAPASANPSATPSPAPETKQIGENQGQKPDQEKPFKRDRDNRRFDELTKRLHEREATIAELRRQVQGVAAPKARSEYSSDEEYIRDLAKHSATDDRLNSQITALEQRQAQEQRQAWNEQVAEQVANPEAFHRELGHAVRTGVIDASTEEYVMSSPVGVKMLEVFLQKSKDHAWKANWDRMPAIKKGIALDDLEKRVTKAPTQARPQQNQAPAPSLSPLKGDRTPGAGGTTQGAFKAKLDRIRNGFR